MVQMSQYEVTAHDCDISRHTVPSNLGSVTQCRFEALGKVLLSEEVVYVFHISQSTLP
jgi:hypothetical protein